MRALRVGVLIVMVVHLHSTHAAPSETPRDDKAPSKITDDNFKKVSKKGLSEADVVSVLGKPNRTATPSEGVTSLFWEDVLRIRVESKDDAVIELAGEFSKHLKSKVVKEAHFKQLKRGMPDGDVEKLLGEPNRMAMPKDGVKVRTWERINQIEVQFQNGKVSGFARVQSLEE